MTKPFDGDAISRADRAYLDSLSDHPLTRDSRYGTPCPPQPDFGPFDPTDKSQEAARQAFFATVIDWMLINWAYREGAFMGRTPGAISLNDGEIISIAELRGRMAPWALLHAGPRGAIKTRSPVDDWMSSQARLSVRREEMRPDQPRPTFIEDGYVVFNRYRPPAHPTKGGDLKPFETYFARLFPDDEERAWLWNWLAHKTRKPWIPMVAVIMVAEEFGSGRGTLFDILDLVFGKNHVAPCAFGELTGKAQGARFNARIADALFVVVNEAVDEDGHQQNQRRTTYDALKNAIEPSPTARRQFEQKNQHVQAQRAAVSAIIATQHRDVIKLPADDRRFSVIICGPRMTAEERAAIRNWMADPANIGALQRALLATPAAPLEAFDPFGEPPPFAGRREMIGMARSGIEDAYETAIDALEGYPLFTMTQAERLIGWFGRIAGGEARVRHTIAKRAYRRRERDEPDNRLRYRGRLEIVYARTEPERQRWRPADREMVAAALNRTEEQIAQIMRSDTDPLAGLARGDSDE